MSMPGIAIDPPHIGVIVQALGDQPPQAGKLAGQEVELTQARVDGLALSAVLGSADPA